MAPRKRMPKIKGIIIPSRWDKNGNIQEVSLHTSDELVDFISSMEEQVK